MIKNGCVFSHINPWILKKFSKVLSYFKGERFENSPSIPQSHTLLLTSRLKIWSFAEFGVFSIHLRTGVFTQENTFESKKIFRDWFSKKMYETITNQAWNLFVFRMKEPRYLKGETFSSLFPQIFIMKNWLFSLDFAMK